MRKLFKAWFVFLGMLLFVLLLTTAIPGLGDALGGAFFGKTPQAVQETIAAIQEKGADFCADAVEVFRAYVP